MNGPKRYLFRMILFLLAVSLALGALYEPLSDAFMANPVLNGLIIGVLLLGVVYIFRQVMLLMREEAWILHFRHNRPGRSVQQAPKLLAPMVAMLGERKGRFSLSTNSLRSLLDGIASRLEESRDLSRYLIGLLIFLGLLGTFWGLLQTIGAVSDVIGGLSLAQADLADMFNKLKTGLKAPLAGMGTAFSSSLFGLAGSLVLGFLELQAGQAQNRFYNDLEDWLAGQTRLSSGNLSVGDEDQAVPAYVQALLEQTADSLEKLQGTLERGEQSQILANNSVIVLSEKLDTFTDQMQTEKSLITKQVETQIEIKNLITKLLETAETKSDENAQSAVRNIDKQLSRLIEQIGAGRTELISEIRSEIRVLARTMAAIAEQAKR